jgi:DNA-binding beta-propeller fold protein YncE
MRSSHGKRALATKFPAHKVSILDVAGDKVTYSKLDLPTGLWPYDVVVTPNGKLALTANGGAGSSDGSIDTVSVVDLEANPPRIIDRVVVGDGPEGLAMSPNGDLAVAAILRVEQQVGLLLPSQRQHCCSEHHRQNRAEGAGSRGGRAP